MRDGDDRIDDPAAVADGAAMAVAAWTMLDKLATFLVHKRLLTMSELDAVALAAADDLRGLHDPALRQGAELLEARYARTGG